MKKLARLLSSGVLVTSFALHAQTSSVQIPLEPLEGGLLALHAQIGGQEGTFLFDSGSGVSNITPEFASRIGCKPWGQITGLRMTGERLDMQKCDNVSLQVGGYHAEPGTVGVFDLARVLPSSMKGIDGTIALDLFDKHSLRLSYRHHLITVYDQRSLTNATAKLKAMPVHIVRDAEGLALTVNLPVVTPHGMAWFEVDSGNTSSRIIVGKHLASVSISARRTGAHNPSFCN